MISLFSPHPILHIGGINLAVHAFFFALAAECAGLILSRYAKRQGLPADFGWTLTAMVFLAGIVGARIGFWLIYPNQLPIGDLFYIWRGGLLSYGGIIAGLLVLRIMLRRLPSIQRAKMWDMAVLAALIAWGVGRFGNYYAADSVGVISSVWSLTYGRVPIQLFEIALCWSVAYVLWRWRPKEGMILPWALVGYFAGRFIIDTWRDETVWGFLHSSQWFCLIVLCSVLLWIITHAKRSS